MLRYAVKNTAEKSRKQVLNGIRRESTNAGPVAQKSGGFGKKLVWTVGLAGAAVGGTLGYASVDPEFRQTLETNVPQSKMLTDAVLGPKAEPVAIQKLPVLQSAKKEVVPPPPAVSQPEKPKKEPVHVDPVDVKKSPVMEEFKPSTPTDTSKENSVLEKQLLSALEAAQVIVKSANDAKVNTIAAVGAHAQKLKKAVDDGTNADWNTVSDSLVQAEKLAKVDMNFESQSRTKIDALRKLVAAGKNNPTTAKNALLLNAQETANKLEHQLDELNGLVQAARNESRVFNQYKDLIQKSREQFTLELKAILPDVDLEAKGKNLSESELNALIAHAHLRVDQLRRQLGEQQVLEEQNIARAIAEQRRADQQLAESQLKIELERVKNVQEVDVERAVQQQREKWEAELEERLRRAASAHSEHLEQVVRTQKQLYDIENAQAVEEAVSRERQLHSQKVELALSKLSGIETALQSRVALDAENRRSKQFWLACQNLVESIVHGQKGGNSMDERRKPLTKELAVIKEACEKDEFVQTVMEHFCPCTISKGVYSEQDLKARFKNVYTLAKRTAKIDQNGGGIMAYMSSYVQSLFMLDLPRRFSVADKIDINNTDTYELIARAKYFVDEGDLNTAVRIMQLLEGEPKLVANDWIKDTQQHLATRFLAELLVSHASVCSIRSVY